MNTIVVQQIQPRCVFQEGLSPIVVQDQKYFITLKQGIQQIIIENFLAPNVIIQGGAVINTMTQPFSVMATVDNQTIFSIGVFPQAIICLFIMGVGQNILQGDYSVSGDQIILESGIPSGYFIFGALEVI